MARKTLMVTIVVIAGFCGLGVVGYYWYQGSHFVTTEDASVTGNQVVVSAQTLAQIASMHAVTGQRVRRGQLLVRLDDSTQQAQENQAEVNVEYAAENVDLEEVKLEQAELDLGRAEVQFQNKIIPQDQYDHVKLALAAARAGYKIAVARRKLTEAELATVRTTLARAVIASPIDGIVAKKWAMPGDVAQPAQPLYTLYDLDNLWIQANFKETELRFVRAGDTATVSVDAYPGLVIAGKVESIGAATASQFSLLPSSNSSGTFTKVTQRVPVKISVEGFGSSGQNGAPRLLPGMSVVVRVHVAR